MSNKRLPVLPTTTMSSTLSNGRVRSLDESLRQPSDLAGHQTTSNPIRLGGNNDKSVSTVSQDTLVSKDWEGPPTTRPKKSSQWWPWEWLCELLAVGSLAAMVFILMRYQNKPQGDWQHAYFTLNGLIAFLATLMKTGIIIPVSAAIGQRKWLRFLPNRKGILNARRLGDFEAFDEASRGALGSAKLMFSLSFW